ncbi:MAG TPA: hypothetical protein VJI32_03985 [Candidatus Nanoarchaeia archaeon]|nr:hypothetical protein [Candidatus Nanoarchaeia archaeon]
MFEFLKRIRTPSPITTIPEAPKPKPYGLAPSTIGISEGVYFLVYENDNCNPRMYFGTSKEFAIYGQELGCTVVVPVERNYGKYIPQIHKTRVWNTPLSKITPKSIAEILWGEMCLEVERRTGPLFTAAPLGNNDRPTLWCEASIEKVLWESYKKDMAVQPSN